jgi:hypothetical protein
VLRELHRRLRPMGFADILDEAIELYKKNFVLLVGIGAFLYVPLALLQLASRAPSADTMAKNPAAVAAYFVRAGAVFLIYWLAATFVTGALTFATSEIYLGHKTTVLACYRRVSKPRVFFSFLWASFVCFCAVLGAALVPIILLVLGVVSFDLTAGNPGPGIVLGILLMFVGMGALVLPAYVATRLAVYTPAFFVEGAGGVSSLGRSWDLLKGKVLSTFGILLVVGLIVFAIKSIILSPLLVPVMRAAVTRAEPSPVIMGIYTFLASALDAVMLPIESMVIILVYYDIRIRKEGFDLEMLALEMGERVERVAGFGPPPLPHEVAPQDVPNQEPPGAEEQG